MKSLTFVISLILFSCHEDKELTLSAKLQVAQKLIIKCKGSDLKFGSIVTKSSEYILSVDDREQVFINRTKFWVDQTFSVDSGNQLKMQTRFRKIELFQDQNGEKETLTVEPNSDLSDPESRIWKYFIASKPFIVWDQHGEIVRHGGLDQLGDSILNSMELDAQTKSLMKQKWDEAVIDMQKSFSQNLFPGFIRDSVIRKGNSWVISIQDKAMDIPLELKTNYTVESWNTEDANFSSSADILIDNAISAQFPGSRIQLNGLQKGNYQIDRSNGLVKKSNVKTEAKGFVNLAGKSVPVKVKNEVSVEPVK